MSFCLGNGISWSRNSKGDFYVFGVAEFINTATTLCKNFQVELEEAHLNWK